MRVPWFRALTLSTLIAFLVLATGYALWHELTAKPSVSVAATDRRPEMKALSAAEEAYAEALLPIQRTVSVAALRMSFTGLAYKTENDDARRLEAAVQQLGAEFRRALDGAGRLDVPESLYGVRDQYVEALSLYEAASVEMMRFVEDRMEEHLIEAQGMSQRASENVLRVGDVLWPGAHKPH